jgi:hypothetical protein
MNRKKGMKKIGKKGKQWLKIRSEELPKFEQVGITRCENCGSDYILDPAHRKKRRYCDEAELRIFSILCRKCHTEIEDSGHENMFNKITAIIENRKVQP